MQERRGVRPSYNYQDVRRRQYAAPAGRQPVTSPADRPPAETSPDTPRQLIATRKSRRRLVIAGVLVLIIVIAGAGSLLVKKDSGPVPKNISQSVSFPIYYPSALPPGYQLEKNAFSVQNGIVFYHLVNGDSTIVISEQTSPSNPLDLKNTPGFGEVPSTAGEAAAGMVNGAPVAVVITEKTMVNIQGSKNTSRDLVAKLAQAMSAPR